MVCGSDKVRIGALKRSGASGHVAQETWSLPQLAGGHSRPNGVAEERESSRPCDSELKWGDSGAERARVVTRASVRCSSVGISFTHWGAYRRLKELVGSQRARQHLQSLTTSEAARVRARSAAGGCEFPWVEDTERV